MIEKIKQLLARYKEVILYLIFGVLTTVVDWGVSFLLYRLWGETLDNMAFFVHVPNVLAWAAAVLFAFVTNRTWVFESKKKGFLPVMGELASFAGGRVMTLLLQEGIFLIFFDLLHINEFAVKIVSAVLVVILNYIISKLFVFRKKREK